MNPDRKQEIGEIAAKILLDTKSVLFNAKEPFVLTSGKVSPVYIDCRRLIAFVEERTTLMDMAVEILHGEIIILCNSLDSLQLINPEIHNIKLKPVLGQAIEIFQEEKNTNFLTLPKLLNINGKNLITLSKEKMIIGSTDEYNFKPEEFYLNELFEFLENKPTWLNKKNISKQWFGIRSRPEGEASPLLKSLAKGLILCSGFYKNGILLAPACSQWVSEEIKKHI